MFNVTSRFLFYLLLHSQAIDFVLSEGMWGVGEYVIIKV
jgi:hypothetical protein